MNKVEKIMNDPVLIQDLKVVIQGCFNLATAFNIFLRDAGEIDLEKFNKRIDNANKARNNLKESDNKELLMFLLIKLQSALPDTQTVTEYVAKDAFKNSKNVNQFIRLTIQDMSPDELKQMMGAILND